jgi:hypothetical protein
MFVDLPGEEWRPIVGYDGRYEVSNLGRLRTWLGLPGKGCQNIRAAFPKLKAHESHRCGYRQASLYSGHQKSRQHYIHRLVAESFIGPTPEGCEVRHLDGDKKNNRLSNLTYGTKIENAKDRRSHGHDRLGEMHHAHKLRASDIPEIKKRRSRGQTWAEISRAYGITPRAAMCAATGITWRHVKKA